MKYKNALVMMIVLSGCLACSEAGLDQPDASMGMPGQGGFQGIAGDIVRPGSDQGTIPQYTDMGASSADTDAPRMAITIPIPPTLAADTATTVCAYLQRCNYTEIAEEVLNEPCQQVIERQMEDAVVNRLRPLQELGMVSFNPQGNRACLSAIEALPCSLDFTSSPRPARMVLMVCLRRGRPALSMKPVRAMRTVPEKTGVLGAAKHGARSARPARKTLDALRGPRAFVAPAKDPQPSMGNVAVTAPLCGRFILYRREMAQPVDVRPTRVPQPRVELTAISMAVHSARTALPA